MFTDGITEANNPKASSTAMSGWKKLILENCNKIRIEELKETIYKDVQTFDGAQNKPMTLQCLIVKVK